MTIEANLIDLFAIGGVLLFGGFLAGMWALDIMRGR